MLEGRAQRAAGERGAAGRGRLRRRAGPSLASALLGAGLLVVLGFALGIVAGLMLEEPQLLLDYVTGKTRSVALAPAAPPAPAELAGSGAAPPDVAAGGPARPAAAPAAAAQPGPVAPSPVRSELDAVRGEAPPGPTAPPAAPAAEGPPAASGPAEKPVASAGRGFSVQVGAFADSAPAEQLARRLKGRGLPVYVTPSTRADAHKWRVRVGPLASRGEAERIAERLAKQEKLPTWVMAEGSL
jgi:DedD protein